MNLTLILIVFFSITYFILKKIFFPHGIVFEIIQHFRNKAKPLNINTLVSNIALPYCRTSISGYYDINLSGTQFERVRYTAYACLSFPQEVQRVAAKFAIKTVKSEDQHWIRKHSIFASYVKYVDIPLLKKILIRDLDSLYVEETNPHSDTLMEINFYYRHYTVPVTFSHIEASGIINIYPRTKKSDDHCCC